MKSPLVIISASLIFVAAIVGLLFYFNVDEQLVNLLRWIQQQGIWAAVLFIAIMALVVVLLLPGVLLTTGAGFVFGLGLGTLYVVVGTTVGAIISFLLARYCFSKRVKQLILERGKINFVTREMAAHDFKVVLLTRLIPFFPGKLSNYFFGIGPFKLRNFAAASLIGFIPFSLNNVYLGSLAANLTNLGEVQAGRTPLQWALYGLGFVATLVAIVYFNRLAKKALADFTPATDSVKESTNREAS